MITYSSCLQLVPFCSVLWSFWFYFWCLYYFFTLTCSKLTEIILSCYFISTWQHAHDAVPLVSHYIYLHFYGKIQKSKGIKRCMENRRNKTSSKKRLIHSILWRKEMRKGIYSYIGDRNDKYSNVCFFHTFQIYLITVFIYLITVLTCEWLCLNRWRNGPPDSEVFHL